MLKRSTTLTAIILLILCASCTDRDRISVEIPDSIEFNLLVGTRQPIDVFSKLPGIDTSTEVIIIEQPQDGVLFQENHGHEHDSPAEEEHHYLSYQHGGASMKADKFVFQLSKNGKAYSRPIVANLTFREGLAKVKIISPKPNEIIESDKVVVAYEILGEDFNHLHISLDNIGHNTIRDLIGIYTLEGFSNGSHSIVAQLVDENHRPVRYEGSKDQVTVVARKNVD